MIVENISGIVTNIKGTIIYMSRACRVIYTIRTISTTWYLINLFQCPIPLAVHIRARTPDEPTGNGIRLPLSNGESDQIISVPDVTIIYIVLLR